MLQLVPPTVSEQIEALDAEGVDTGTTALDRILQDLARLPDIEAESSLKQLAEKTKLSLVLLRSELKKIRKETQRSTTDSESRSKDSVQVAPVYDEVNGSLECTLLQSNSSRSFPIANFTAKIQREIIEDDGIETRTRFEIRARIKDRDLVVSVSAAEFESMDWVLEKLGSGAVIYSGRGIRDHVRAAIQQLSAPVPSIRVFTHVGWRTNSKGEPVYLHAGGGIGKDGLDSTLNVSVPGALGAFHLPPPPRGETLIAQISRVLQLRVLGPHKVIWPLMACAFRAIFGHCDHSVFLVGPTGVFKSELAAIVQSFFGSGFHSRNLPASWSSTGNALESMLCLVKDAVLVIDDWAPHGGPQDLLRYQREADRVLRAQGNASGRARLTADAQLRTTRFPRGSLLSTGEDVPTSQSIKSRLVTVQVSQGTIDSGKLSIAQTPASRDARSATMSAFIEWVAQRYEEVHAKRVSRMTDLRDLFASQESHRRMSTNAAELQSAVEVFLEFARAKSAISEQELENLRQECMLALCDSTTDIGHEIRENEPTEKFRILLQSAILSGEAHLNDGEGNAPPGDETSLGWQKRFEPRSEGEGGELFIPKGKCIGFIINNELYLDPVAAHKAAQRAASVNEPFSITCRMLLKRLSEKGLLLSQETDRGRHTVRVMVNKVRKVVLHVQMSFLLEREPEPAKSTQQQALLPLAPETGGKP